MRFLSGNQDGAHWHLVSPEGRVLKRLWFPSVHEASKSLETFVRSIKEDSLPLAMDERGVLLEALFHLESYFDTEINKAQTLALQSRVSSLVYEECMERYQGLVSRREILQSLRKRVDPNT